MADDAFQSEEQAAALREQGPVFEEPDPPPPPRPVSKVQLLLILLGIGVIITGICLLVVFGSTFNLNKPAPQRLEPEQVRLGRILSRWDRMDSTARQAALPELVRAFKEDDENLRLGVMLTLTDAGPGSVDELAKALNDNDFNVRFYAAWTLGRIGPDAAPAVPALLEARTDLNGDVRRKAVYALGRIRPPADQTIPVLIETFKDDDVDVRRAAVEAVAGYGKEAVPALIAALGDKSFAVRRQAVLTLTEIGPEAVPALAALRPFYLDAADGLQDEAAVALASIGPPALPLLAKALQTDPVAPPGQVVLGLGSPWALLGVWRDFAAEHRRAIDALGKINLEALDTLLAALKNPNADVRAQAAGQLGLLGYRDKRVVVPLVDALRDPEDDVRKQAGWALQQLLPDARLVIPGARLALTDANPETRFNTVSFLSLQGPAAVPLLVEAIKDKDEKVQVQAVKALHELKVDNDYLKSSVLPLLKEADPLVRRNAVSVLHRCGLPALEPLFGALKDSDVKVRQQAIQAVTTIPGDEKLLVPVLTEALEDDDPFVRGRATAALGRTGGVRALPQLQQSLKDKEDEVRLEAVEALLQLNPNFPQVLPSLLPALQDKSPAVRLVAVAGLARFNAAAVPHLIQALKDDDDKVWKQAKDTLLAIELPERVLEKTLFPALIKALSDETPGVRQGACKALVRFKSDAVPYLVAALKDPDVFVKNMAADSLDDIGLPARKAIPALVELATTTDNEKLRGRALMALVTLQGFDEHKRNPAKALSGIIKLLNDPDDASRMHAIQTLGAFGPPARDALPQLTKLANDKDPSISAAARLAAQRIRMK